ncbi:MAG TPA: enolase C-terminal domain-like protein [Bryobacteraceae bacterium]|jgi:galactonate dehydratase
MRTKRRKLPGAGVAVFAPAAPANHPLKIVQFRAWRVKEPVSNRRYTIVCLKSQGGTSGYGEGGPATGSEIAGARNAVIGRRATESEFIRVALHRQPPLEAAVSNAMLDLVSRAKNVPIYQYLGGPVRYKARLLAHLEGKTRAEVAPSLERARKQGFQAFTISAPQRDPMIPLQAYIDLVRKHMTDIQAMSGAAAEWVVDGEGAMTPGDAASVANALERFHPIWFDEPTSVITQDGLAKIVEESVTPIGLGRRITDIVGFQGLLASGSLNIVRPDLALNSLTKIKRVAAIAETHYVAIAPFHNGGPIGAMAGIHLNAALINAYAQQIPVPAADRDAAMRAEITSGLKETCDKGFFALMNRPGLGFDVSERALDAYSEERI